MGARRGDRGQVMVLVAALGVVATGGILVFVASLGAVTNDRARARTAADASALAGAASGEAAAAVVADRNGGVIEAYRAEANRVEVTVRVGRARATSVAERSWQARSFRGGGSRWTPVIPYTRHDVFHRFGGDP